MESYPKILNALEEGFSFKIRNEETNILFQMWIVKQPLEMDRQIRPVGLEKKDE